MRCRASAVNADAAAIVIDGKPVGRLGVTARRRLGAAFVPEERLGHGAVPALQLVGERRADPPSATRRA